MASAAKLRTIGRSRSAPRSACLSSAPGQETRAARRRERPAPEAGLWCAAGLPGDPEPLSPAPLGVVWEGLGTLLLGSA
eukprot:7329311-Alexandrium_andersonii.AAC.1